MSTKNIRMRMLSTPRPIENISIFTHHRKKWEITESSIWDDAKQMLHKAEKEGIETVVGCNNPKYKHDYCMGHFNTVICSVSCPPKAYGKVVLLYFKKFDIR